MHLARIDPPGETDKKVEVEGLKCAESRDGFTGGVPSSREESQADPERETGERALKRQEGREAHPYTAI